MMHHFREWGCPYIIKSDSKIAASYDRAQENTCGTITLTAKSCLHMYPEELQVRVVKLVVDDIRAGGSDYFYFHQCKTKSPYCGLGSNGKLT
jgi:hypothetical protein